jgi:hypothetical protein
VTPDKARDLSASAALMGVGGRKNRTCSFFSWRIIVHLWVNPFKADKHTTHLLRRQTTMMPLMKRDQCLNMSSPRITAGGEAAAPKCQEVWLQ